jgi:putative nucleotidyltransferase with HDIG domain
MGKGFSAKGKRARIAVLVLSIALVSLFHFLIPTEPHTYHKVHIVLRKLYFLPPVMAAAWFGLRGAAITTIIVSIVFIIHAFLDWPGNYMEQANQLGELVSFWVVGLVPGYLFDRQRLLMESLAKAHEETLFALVSSLDMRGKNTPFHSQRVRDYTLVLAERYGVPEGERRAIGLGALLHDVGKISIPDYMFLKHAGYSPEELKVFRTHPEKGYKLLRRIGFLQDAAEIVYAHQERFDGTGYPRGLKGRDIPLGARLFAVAEALDELTFYHAALSFEKAGEIIQARSGTHFDPAVVEVLVKVHPAEWEAIRKSYADLSEIPGNGRDV